MYPFYILGVGELATDDEVEARYAALLLRHPPDRDPERFRVVREAYEALRTPALRREARLFYLGGQRPFSDELRAWLDGGERARLTTAQLGRLLR